ncbi:MAG: GNAT family N-acetyltransferase [Acidobacteriota bacterium]
MSESTAFHIRSATEADVPLVLDFVHRLAEYEKLAHEVVATEDQIRDALFGADAHVEVVFACEGDQAAGFALFFRSFSTFLGRPNLYLEDLFVGPEHRGKGYGKALLAHLAKLAVERGYGRMEWIVLDWNEPAIRFYESLGAVGRDDWRVFHLRGEALERLAEG